VAVSADADVTKDQCIEANASAQRLRLAEKLDAAHKELLTCANPACPAIVRDDCARRLDEIDRAQPSVIFDVKDASGQDMANVTVRVDGTVVTTRLDGAPRIVDPGVHVFTFEAAGSAPVTRTFVIKEEEKGRRERIVMTPEQVPLEPRPSAPASTAWSAQRVVGVGLAGLGVAAIAVGSVFGGLADAAWNDQKSACGSPTSCSGAGHAAAVSDHATLTTDGAVSTAAFIAAGALVAGGAALFFTAPRASAPSSGLRIAPAVGSRAAALVVGASF
jgi:hypothetical protein